MVTQSYKTLYIVGNVIHHNTRHYYDCFLSNNNNDKNIFFVNFSINVNFYYFRAKNLDALWIKCYFILFMFI